MRMLSRFEMGRLIRNARKARRMSAADCAVQIGKHANWWYRLELGFVDPQMGDLKEVARVLRVPMMQLISTERSRV